MHNLGQSSMEFNMNHEDEFTGHEAGSPLNEILANVGIGGAMQHEFPVTQEYSAGEFPSHEYGSAELPLGEYAYEQPEGAFHEMGLHELGAHEFQHEEESPLGEFQQAETLHEDEYHEAWAPEAGFGEAPYGEYAHEAPYGEYAQEASVGHEIVAGEGEALFEEEVLELTAELLSVNNEEELDRFLGKLVRRVSRAAGNFIRSPVGRLVGGVLRQVARRALPIAGAALGSFVGGPAGSMIGGRLASLAGRAMGLELQEMSASEADFAAARQFVRLATDIVRKAESGQGTPPVAVRRAFTSAAQRFAPGLLGPQAPRLPIPRVGSVNRGVWIRRGRTITLYGV